MMAFSMALQFLDKSALPAASILGIIEDLVRTKKILCELLLKFSRTLSAPNTHGQIPSLPLATSPPPSLRDISWSGSPLLSCWWEPCK